MGAENVAEFILRGSCFLCCYALVEKDGWTLPLNVVTEQKKRNFAELPGITHLLVYIKYTNQKNIKGSSAARLWICAKDEFYNASLASGKLKEWSLVLYGTSVHPYSSLRSDKPRSTDILPPTDEEFTEEYNGTW